MGKRGDSGAGAPPTAVSAKVQAMVDRAMHLHGKTVPQASVRPQATPARAVNTPTVETPEAAPKATEPSMSVPGPSPMSTHSTPLKSPDAKRHRSASGLSSDGAASTVPSLPSFSGSASSKPKHSDSSTTIRLSQDLTGTQMEEDTLPPAADGLQIFCGIGCLMRTMETGKQGKGIATTAAEPDPEAPVATTTPAAAPTTSTPPPETHAAETQMSSPGPPTPVASVSVKAGEAVASAESSAGAVYATANSTEATAKAWVHCPTEKPMEVDDKLETELAKLIDEAEVENANQRADEAESKARALQSLMTALLAMPPETHTARASIIHNMLRRPATCDIEAMTKQLQTETTTTATAAGMTENSETPKPSLSVPPTSEPSTACVPAAIETQTPMPAENPTAASAASVPAAAEKPTENPTATAAASVPDTEKPTENPTATAAASVPNTEKPTENPTATAAASVPDTEKPTENPTATAAASAAGVGVTETSKPTENPTATAAASVPAAAGVNQGHVKQEPEPEATGSVPKPNPAVRVKEEPGTRTRDRENETDEARKSSADCPPEVREKALTAAGQKRSTSVMRHMYEMWISSGCDWMRSSIMLNAKKRNNTRRTGRHVWKRFDLLKTEPPISNRHGSAIAEDIRASKKGMDPNGSGRWWKVHPDQPKNEDWELFKCFDSRVEVSESEDEVEFNFGSEVGLDGAGTNGVLSHLLDDNAPRGSNDLPPPPPPNRRLTNKGEKKAKAAEQEALDLLRKGTQRIIEADGMESMLLRGGMGDAFAKAMVADMKADVDLMKERHAGLQHAVTTKQADGEIGTLNVLLKASYGIYDEKMKAVKRAIRPAPKAKAKGKAQAKAKAAA
ncbi:unnamed protein product [Symbiodinium sp. CCMP2456]|nr:unnamed protein product [Symbiodinium sp. CCMP2456]